MNLCFAHDFPMIKDKEGNVYSQGGFSYEVWKRYLEHFSNITVVGRHGYVIKDSNQNTNLSLSSGSNVNFVSIPNLSSLKGKIFDTREAKHRINNILEKSDALIARLPSEIGKLAVKLAKRMNMPYLIELVGCPYDAYRFYGNIKGKIYAPISMYETKKIIKQSRFTIYVTKHYLQRRYPTNGKRTDVSNVYIKEATDNIIINRLKSIKNIKNRKLVIGMIGSLESKYKGFDKTIKYLSIIKPHSNKFELRILGGGNKDKLEEFVESCNMKSHVFLDGIRSSGEGVFEWLDNIDLYIQPSLTEGLPRALIEALSRGCLAIGSNRGGIPELLSSRYTFDPLNINDFIRCMNNVLKDPIENQIYNNINKSQEYTVNKLSDKRNRFLEEFSNSVKKGK